jgi:hypothetical protein
VSVRKDATLLVLTSHNTAHLVLPVLPCYKQNIACLKFLKTRVKIYWISRGTYCLLLCGRLINWFYTSTRCHNSVESRLQSHLGDSLQFPCSECECKVLAISGIIFAWILLLSAAVKLKIYIYMLKRWYKSGNIRINSNI